VRAASPVFDIATGARTRPDRALANRAVMQVVLLTGHHPASARRAGFHWLADAWRRQGHDVLFVTVSVSWLSYLRRDYRTRFPLRKESRGIRRLPDGMQGFVWFTPWHPANLRLAVLNRLSTPLFARYDQLSLGPLQEPLRTADLILFESTPAILLAQRVRRLNPRARIVYRVSDDVRALRMHPIVIEREPEVLDVFDLISAPSAGLHAKFASLSHVQSKAKLYPHGLQVDLFDAPCENPYADGFTRHAVFSGISHIDYDALRIAAESHPDIGFHYFGPLDVAPFVRLRNVTLHGERPFRETVPYIRHADLGLQAVRPIPGVEALADSLKMLQYAYCKLPTIAPALMRSTRSNVFSYDAVTLKAIGTAVSRALAADRNAFPAVTLLSWDDVANLLAGPLASSPVATNTGSDADALP
jgi:2-beta-glucuronyltransferase